MRGTAGVETCTCGTTAKWRGRRVALRVAKPLIPAFSRERWAGRGGMRWWALAGEGGCELGLESVVASGEGLQDLDGGFYVG